VRVIVVHNASQQRGGEDSVVEEETRLLKRFGHSVTTYSRHNDELSDHSWHTAASDAIWSRRTVREVNEVIARSRPDLFHVHNTFPLISPSVFHVAARARIPVVQTLHNFRLVCPQGMLLRDQRPCEDCLGKLPWRGVIHGCYRSSYSQSAVLAAMTAIHRKLGTYDRCVTRYIALSRFSKEKLVQAGFAPSHVSVKPNFADLPAPMPDGERKGALFVGRLSPEKGTRVLAAAVAIRNSSIDVVGTGPEEKVLATMPGINLLGWQPPEKVYARMQRASCLILPSVCYENFPRTIVEAFACGTPVIASRLGALAEIVEDGHNGLLFEPGNPDDLDRKLHWAETHANEMRRMGEAARKEYELKYTASVNIALLEAIYQDALEAYAAFGGRAATAIRDE
jgi:glycosyltransferase involved in cell wall biosynthesis